MSRATAPAALTLQLPSTLIPRRISATTIAPFPLHQAATLTDEHHQHPSNSSKRTTNSKLSSSIRSSKQSAATCFSSSNTEEQAPAATFQQQQHPARVAAATQEESRLRRTASKREVACEKNGVGGRREFSGKTVIVSAAPLSPEVFPAASWIPTALRARLSATADASGLRPRRYPDSCGCLLVEGGAS